MSDRPQHTLPEIIRQTRLSQGLSMEKLARRADCNINTIWKLENGETTRPHYGPIERIAEVLGIDRIEMFRLWSAYRRLSPIERKVPSGDIRVLDHEKLLTVRNRKGFTRAAVAQRAGMQNISYNRLESGVKSTSRPHTISRIAEALRVEPREITSWVQHPGQTPSLPHRRDFQDSTSTPIAPGGDDLDRVEDHFTDEVSGVDLQRDGQSPEHIPTGG